MDNKVQEFFQKASSDPELSQKISEICQQASPTAAAELAALAQRSGSPLTEDDFLAAAPELSDAQLEGVSGGFSYGWKQNVLQPDGTYKLVLVLHNK
jgi:predicted ribosomally synthesized peptide with nif11-like leader